MLKSLLVCLLVLVVYQIPVFAQYDSGSNLFPQGYGENRNLQDSADPLAVVLSDAEIVETLKQYYLQRQQEKAQRAANLSEVQRQGQDLEIWSEENRVPRITDFEDPLNLHLIDLKNESNIKAIIHSAEGLPDILRKLTYLNKKIKAFYEIALREYSIKETSDYWRQSREGRKKDLTKLLPKIAEIKNVFLASFALPAPYRTLRPAYFVDSVFLTNLNVLAGRITEMLSEVDEKNGRFSLYQLNLTKLSLRHLEQDLHDILSVEVAAMVAMLKVNQVTSSALDRGRIAQIMAGFLAMKNQLIGTGNCAQILAQQN